MPHLRLISFFCSVAGFMATGCAAAYAQTDNPFIKNYPRNAYYSSDFSTAPQNWGFAQDENGVLFLANTYGILTFDGMTWRKVKGSGDYQGIRIRNDEQGRVWVGSQTDFGYLKPDPAGELRFVSLLGDAAAAAGEPAIRSIWCTGEVVWFVGAENIWRYHTSDLTLGRVPVQSGILNAFLQAGRLYVRLEGEGIFEVTPQGISLATRADRAVPGKVQVILPLPAQGPGPGPLLLITRQDGIFLLKSDRLTPWSEDFARTYPDLQIWDAELIGDKQLGIATQTHGLVLFDTAGHWISNYTRETGLLSNSLITLYQDRQGGIWVSSDIGVSRIEYPPRLQFFGFSSFLEGGITSVARIGDRIWVGGASGLFRASIPSRHAFLFFQKEPLQTEEVWDLESFSGDLIAASSTGVWVKSGANPFRLLATGVARTLCVSSRYPGRVYVGWENGVGVLEQQGKGWSYAGLLEGVAHPVMALAEDLNGDLWASHRQTSRIRLRDGARSLTPEVQLMGLQEGFTEALDIVEPSLALGKVRFGTYNGVRIFDETAGVLLPDPDLPPEFTDGSLAVYLLREAPGGHIWMSTGTENGWFEDIGKNASTGWNSAPLNPIQSDVLRLYPDDSGLVWIGALEGLYLFDADQPVVQAPPFKALIRRIDHSSLGLIYAGSGRLPEFTAPYSKSVVRITCSASTLAFSEQVRFRFRLEGFDREWSEWAVAAEKEYAGLPEGTYRFWVQAKDLYGTVSETASFSFRVYPPWYRAWYAWILYGLGIAGAIALLVRFFWRGQQKKLAAKEHELDLERKAIEKLRQVDRLKDEFLANTSHELRTPLHGIIGLSEALIDKVTTDDQRQDLSLIISSGKRLATLVNDLLDFSKLKNHEIELRLRPVDLHSLASVVAYVHLPLLAKKPVKLLNEIPVGTMALADEDRVQQILFNLVGNAVKFTSSGVITLQATTAQGKVVISVKDTGIGIMEEKKNHIFEAFQQAEGDLTRSYEGAGLGLTISRKLAELHGGSLWVESEWGAGATFFFDLPTAPAAAKGTKPTNPPGLPALALPQKPDGLTEGAALRPDANQARILVVDDEPINQQVLRNILAGNTFHLVQAMSGAEALQLLEGNARFDLVLLDVMMPGMSGYDVCRKIRERWLPSELPVLMITAKNQIQDLVEGLSIGANDYITKPFSKDEFLARVQTHLNLFRIHQVMGKFVPQEFLRALGKSSITDIRLGDHVERQVTIVFADIRNYTALAESMTPEETFQFVNSFHGRLGPVIARNQGLIVQFLGDGFMALFPESPRHALDAAIEVQQEMMAYNAERTFKGRPFLTVGLGMHTGPLIMGIIGDDRRFDAATIADTVNIASRMEGLTKPFGSAILFSGQTYEACGEKNLPHNRFLGKIRVKGRGEPLRVFECLDGLPPERRQQAIHASPIFEVGMEAYFQKRFSDAADAFSQTLAIYPADHAARLYLHGATRYLLEQTPDNWSGVVEAFEK